MFQIIKKLSGSRVSRENVPGYTNTQIHSVRIRQSIAEPAQAADAVKDRIPLFENTSPTPAECQRIECVEFQNDSFRF